MCDRNAAMVMRGRGRQDKEMYDGDFVSKNMSMDWETTDHICEGNDSALYSGLQGSLGMGQYPSVNYPMTMCDGNESQDMINQEQVVKYEVDFDLDMESAVSVGTSRCLNSRGQWEEAERRFFDDWWYAVAIIKETSVERKYELAWSPIELGSVLRSIRRRGCPSVEDTWGLWVQWNPITPGDCLFESIGFAILGKHVDGSIMRRIAVYAYSSLAMRPTLARAARQLRMSTTSHLQAIDGNLWGGSPDLQAICHATESRVIVWDH